MGGTNSKPVARVQPKRAVGTTRRRPQNAKSDAAGAGSFPCIVGVGASAGGFDALVEFLHVLPPNSGLSFIILQHLSPSPRSLSAELFSRHTTMRVSAAEEGARLEANCVYTTPADRDIRVKGGRIRLSRPTEGRGHWISCFDHWVKTNGNARWASSSPAREAMVRWD